MTPILLCVGLVGGLVLQAAAPVHTALSDDAGVAPRRLRLPAPAMTPDYPAILKAPVFAPDRRPGEAAAAAGAQGLQLVGLAAFGRGAASAVVRTPDGVNHVVKTGESLQGWRFDAVAGDRALFSGPGGTLRLAVTAASVSSGAQP